MSRENLEILRRAYERVNATLESPQELFEPEVELDVRDVTVEFGVVRGAKPHRRLCATTGRRSRISVSSWSRCSTSTKTEWSPLPGMGGRLKGSDAEVWNRLFHVATFRDGRIVRFSSHTEKKQALEAAGLSE